MIILQLYARYILLKRMQIKQRKILEYFSQKEIYELTKVVQQIQITSGKFLNDIKICWIFSIFQDNFLPFFIHAFPILTLSFLSQILYNLTPLSKAMSDPLFLSTFPLLFSFKLFAFFFYSFELSTVFSFKFYDNLMGMPVFYTPFLLFLS